MGKKAFTLIELLVVVAVIGILVLLGIPRFTGHKDKVELTRIQHDVKVMEQEIGTVFVSNGDEFNNWEYNSKDLNQFAQEGRLFEKKGIAETPIDGSYKVIPEKYKGKINTKLKGTFYTNDGGKVYYEHTKPLSGIPTESEEEQVLEGPIPIATAEELNNIRNATIETYGKGTEWEGKYLGGLDKEYFQVADVDLSGYSEEGWDPIGNRSSSFTGTYDGGNYVITNLNVNGYGKDEQGLFGYTEGATIRNVGLEDVKVTGGSKIGGLVGLAYDNTMISNSYATGSVEGLGSSIGGLVGLSNYKSTISNSYATVSVTGDSFVGGLAGGTGSSTKINNSYATGSVESTGDVAGGLVGSASWGSSIEESYAEGSVKGTGTVGGLVGYAEGSPQISSSTKISKSYSKGPVIGSGNYVGGLVGRGFRNIAISNSYVTGSVTGSAQVGGLVGRADDSPNISNSYTTGPVEGGSRAGGLVGYIYSGGTISNSYWDKQTTKQTRSAGQSSSFGKLTEEMMNQATYSDWDFTNVWEITPGNYPTLR